MAGLNYKYYHSVAGGNWCDATGLASQNPTSTGNVANFSLAPKQRESDFGREYTGFIDIPADGNYTFYLNSDDESRLYIGSQQVVTHAGCHGTLPSGQEPSGQICLKAGKHALKVLFSQGGGGYGLEVQW